MIKIAIYDDSAGGNRNYLASLVSRFFSSKNIPHSITTFDSGLELLKILNTEPLFDIVFLGVIMPERYPLNTNFATSKCVFLFSVYTDEFTLREKPLYTFDYFFYSARQSAIISSLERVLARINKNKRYVPIKCKGCVQNFPTSKIVYIESSKHYLYFHITNGTTLKMYAKLDEYENMLSEYNNFLRCHQSFIVNMDFIKQQSGRDFILEGNIHIPIRKAGFSIYKKKYFTYSLVKNSDASVRY